jgi:hypothetical protein
MCRDEVRRNGLHQKSEGDWSLRSRRAVAGRVHHLQNSYDVHESQSDRCNPAPKRNGPPMAVPEEVLLILHVSQSI